MAGLSATNMSVLDSMIYNGDCALIRAESSAPDLGHVDCFIRFYILQEV